LRAAVEAQGEQVLAKFKRPRHLVLLGEPLPRTFSGKISKPELRKRFAQVPADALPLFRR